MNSTSEMENPIIIEPIIRKIIIPIIFLYIFIIPLYFAFITLPVFKYGTYDAIFPTGNMARSSKIILFYLAFFTYAYAIASIPRLKFGNIFFFSDRMIIKSFLYKKNYTIYYNKINTELYLNKKNEYKVIFISPVKYKFSNNFLIKTLYNHFFGFYIITNKEFLKCGSKINEAILLLIKNSLSSIVK